MAQGSLSHQVRVFLTILFFGTKVFARGPLPGCGDGSESCEATRGQDAPDTLGLLQQRTQRSQGTRAVLRPATGAVAEGMDNEIGLDMLVMADIGHPREYSNNTYLTSPWPMEYSRVEGSFSLYDGLANYIIQQGVRPKSVLIIGDVAYGGGTHSVLQSVKTALQKYSGGKLPENWVFPGIGNHDVNYLGCTKTPQLANLKHPLTCFYGSETVLKFASSKQMTYSSWVNNWVQAFPGLAGGNIILPPRTTTGTCKTTGGTANGAECQFPFTHLTETYNGCITSRGYEAPWCYTGGLFIKKWGYCSTTCTPEISSWAVPTRYNLDLNPSSSVYIIVGLIAGAELTYWNDDTPPESVPVGGPSGSQAECKFLSDSLAHGKSLGKTVFIYATHWFQEGCEDWSLVQQIDIWLYGHDHNMWQAPPPLGTVVQEQRYFPAAMLLGNGGFDDGETKQVGFVHLTEEIADGRSKVHIKVLDTCESTTKCPSVPNPNFAQCWHECKDYPDGFNNRKAVPSSTFGFTYDAARSIQSTSGHSLDFPAKLQLNSKWIALGECGSVAHTFEADVFGSYRSVAGSLHVDPHSSMLASQVESDLKRLNLSSIETSSSIGGSSNSSGNSSGSSSSSSSSAETSQCLVGVEDKSEAATIYFYDVSDTSARLTVDSSSRAPLVMDGKVFVQRYGFYDLYDKLPTPPFTSPTGVGRMLPQDGYLLKFASMAAEGENMALGIDFVDGVLQLVEDGNAKIPAYIVRA